MDNVQELRHTDRSINQRLAIALLTPSWLSGLIAVVAGLVVAVGVIILFGLNNSQVQQQLVGLQNTSHESALTLPGEAPPSAGANSLQNTWPLLAFWGIIGLIVYFIVEAAMKAIGSIAELKDEMNYVHARRDLVKTSIELFAFRLVVVVVWLIFIDIFFKRIIPYSITAAYASASNPFSLYGFVYALLAFTMIVLSMHMHAIFLRLSLRRPRVFSSDITL